MTLIDTRLAELNDTAKEKAQELLEMFPLGEREDHLEAFELQTKRKLSADCLGAFEAYVNSNGGKKKPLHKAQVVVEAKFRSSFGGAAVGKLNLDNPIKSLNEDKLPREFGLMANKRNFQVEVINSVTSAYRCMDLSVAKRSEYLAARTESFAKQVLPTLVSEDVQIGRIGTGGSAVSQAVVGRICAETDGPLNGHNLIIEGDLTNSAGRRAKFYVSECQDDYCLFPGQIVGVVGRSLRGGEEFAAQSISGLEISSLPDSPVEARAGYAGGSVHVTVASGPFSPKETLNFQVFAEITKFVSDYKPHVLVLMGPFLDAANSIVSSACIFDSTGIPVTFESVYDMEIFPRLDALAKTCVESETKLIIVPSLTEMIAEHPLPQPPLSDWEKKFPGCIAAANPSIIRINCEFDLMVTSADAVMPLTSEVFVSPSLSDKPRVDVCLEQILRQRHLFPSGTVPVDASRAASLGWSGAGPHAFCLVSPVQQFAKSVGGRVFMNPGQVCKGSSGGSIGNFYIAAQGVDRVRAEVAKLI